MKLAIILSILIMLLAIGCSKTQVTIEPTIKQPKISSIKELLLNSDDLTNLNMSSDKNNCQFEEYQTGESSPLMPYSFCNYTINGLKNTLVIIEMKKFSNLNDLNGSYQYDSSHLFSVEGLISENDFGDQSRFRVSNEHDYGGEFNKPGEYYYHLWFTKGEYLVHITSGKDKEAKEYIANIGRTILKKFE